MVDFGTFRPERPFQDLVLEETPPRRHLHAQLPRRRAHARRRRATCCPYLFEARKRGVIFDVGHGGGSFLFRQAVPAMQQGFMPDSISTDLHVTSMNAGMKDMLNVMSKFLNMGMPLDDVIAALHLEPRHARSIARTSATSPSGAPADVAVLRLANGDFGFVDVYGARLKGDRKLECELTVRDGKVVWDLNGISREDWDKLGKYGPQGDNRWDGTLGEAVRSRK